MKISLGNRIILNLYLYVDKWWFEHKFKIIVCVFKGHQPAYSYGYISNGFCWRCRRKIFFPSKVKFTLSRVDLYGEQLFKKSGSDYVRVCSICLKPEDSTNKLVYAVMGWSHYSHLGTNT